MEINDFGAYTDFRSIRVFLPLFQTFIRNKENDQHCEATMLIICLTMTKNRVPREINGKLD